MDSFSLNRWTKKIITFTLFATFLTFPIALDTAVSTASITLNPGDLIVADFNMSDQTGLFGTGRVLRVDPVSGATSIISEGGALDSPWGVIVDSSGNIFVSDQARNSEDVGAIIKVDPVTGNQTILTEGGMLSRPTGMVIDPDGNLLVGNLNWTGDDSIVKIDPYTGEQSLVSGGGYVRWPGGVAIDPEGELYVIGVNTDQTSNQHLVSVDPETGVQEVLYSQLPWASYSGIVFNEALNKIFVTEIYSFNGVFEIDLNVNPVSHRILRNGYPFQDPWGITIDPDGFLLVADSNWHYPDGKIIKLDPVSGSIVRTYTDPLLKDPAGVAVYPALPTNQTPVAAAGSDQAVFDEVTLDGATSHDPDGTIESYVWELSHREDPANDRSAEGANPTLSDLAPGFYDVTLTVTDDYGATDTDAMILAVAGECSSEGLYTLEELEQYAAQAVANAVAPLEDQLTAASAEITALQEAKADLESQLAAASAEIAALQESKAALESQLAAAEAKLSAAEQSIADLAQTLQSAFSDPLFSIPGDSPEEQINTLVDAIGDLNHGQQQALYDNLGGTKGKAK